MSKIAFIYPGQGAQKCGMGKDFYEGNEKAQMIFDKASELLEMDVKALCFEENDKLDITEYTQAAMVTTCLAMTAVVKEKGLEPLAELILAGGEGKTLAEIAADFIDEEKPGEANKEGLFNLYKSLKKAFHPVPE